MGRNFLLGLGALILSGFSRVGQVLAQAPSAGGSEGASESSGPVFPYGVILLFTLLTLVIVCMPSRKT